MIYRTWKVADLTAIVAVALAAMLVSACSEQSTATPTPAPQVTVESGVTALTPAAPGSGIAGETVAVEPGGTLAAPPTDPGTLAPGTLAPGTEVQARGILRVYAEANPDAPTLAEYTAGNRFIVVDPPGTIVAYPVESSGVRWYRVRAEDGLVGWVMADGIELLLVE